MKIKVILEAPVPEPTQTVRTVANEKFYGVVEQGGARGMVIKPDYEKTDFKVAAYDCMTVGNNYWSLDHKASSLSEYLKMLVEKNVEVYQFDSLSELALWIEQKKS